MSEKSFMNNASVPDTRVTDEMGNIVSGTAGYVKSAGSGRGFVNPPNVVPNPYSHDTSKMSPSEEFKLNFFPNILDNYDTYTYHWKLFITSLQNSRNGTVLDVTKQVIIAESGVTDLTIDNVELNGIAVPSVEAGTGTQTLVKFEIVEPSGAGLLDKMFYQATALGIGNWLVMPCFLQLEFRGRDSETGASVDTGAPGALSGLKWVWPLKLTNSKAHVTQVGTKYNFDAIIYNELAQSNSYFAIQHNITLANLDKFGDAMRDLTEKLNDDQYEKLLDNYSIPDRYTIVVDPDLLNINIKEPTDNTSTTHGGDFVTFKNKTATFNSGTGIDKIIDCLLGNTSHFQKLMQSAETPSSEPEAANAAKSQMKKLWRVITETKPIAFDMLRQDNAVDITIYIIEYKLGATDVVASQTGQTPETLPAAKKRLGQYAANKILNKKYDYIFTGLNDQITNFDLNMNFSFAASLARFGGIYYDSFVRQPGVAVDKDAAEKEKNAKEEIRKAIQFINSAKTEQDADTKIKEARAALEKSKIDPFLEEKYKTLLDNAKKKDRQRLMERERNTAAGLDGSKNRARMLAEPVTLVDSDGNNIGYGRFISDVDFNSPTAQAAHQIAISNKKGKLRPIAFREGKNEGTFNSIDPSNNAGRARVANVFATALYSTLDASLQHIKITIKGDPYWLFPEPVPQGANVLQYKSNLPDQNDAIKLLKSSGTDKSVNLFGSDNFIVIRFRTPKIANDTTGFTEEYKEVETFSGVYKVITIVSKFSAGKFTQELTCILDPMINLTEFLKEVENATKSQDVLTSGGPGNTISASAATNHRGGHGFDTLDPRRLDRYNAGAGRGVINPEFVIPTEVQELPNAGAGRGFVNPGPGGGSSTQSIEIIRKRTNT